MPRLFLPAMIALTCCISLQSQAADVLTKQNIEEYYQSSVDAQLAGKKEALSYFQKHLASDIKMIMNFYVKVNGSAPQKKSKTYNKSQMMEQTKFGYDNGQILQITNRVLAVDIEPDGRSADVKDSTMVISVMTIDNPEGTGKMRVRSEQTLLCTSKVVLNKKDVIQSKRMVCNVDSQVEKVNN